MPSQDNDLEDLLNVGSNTKDDYNLQDTLQSGSVDVQSSRSGDLTTIQKRPIYFFEVTVTAIAILHCSLG